MCRFEIKGNDGINTEDALGVKINGNTLKSGDSLIEFQKD